MQPFTPAPGGEEQCANWVSWRGNALIIVARGSNLRAPSALRRAVNPLQAAQDSAYATAPCGQPSLQAVGRPGLFLGALFSAEVIEAQGIQVRYAMDKNVKVGQRP
jgi:hypothetical protein